MSSCSAAASNDLRQFNETSDCSRHHHQTLEVLRDRSDVAEAIVNVSKGAGARLFPALRRYIVQWRFVRISELSVERLHRLSSLTASYAPHHTGPYVSLFLRGPEVIRWSLADYAISCASVSHCIRALLEFGLVGHNAIQTLREEQLSKGKTWTDAQMSRSHRLIRACFCRYDLFIVFDPLSDLQCLIFTGHKCSRSGKPIETRQSFGACCSSDFQ